MKFLTFTGRTIVLLVYGDCLQVVRQCTHNISPQIWREWSLCCQICCGGIFRLGNHQRAIPNSRLAGMAPDENQLKLLYGKTHLVGCPQALHLGAALADFGLFSFGTSRDSNTSLIMYQNEFSMHLAFCK